MTIKKTHPPRKINWFNKYSSRALTSCPPPPPEKGKVVKLRQPNKIVLDRKETCK